MELVKKGKRTYGAFLDLSAQKVYVAFRTPGDFFLDAKPGQARSIAQGLQDGDASWAIDDETLMKARRRGVTLVAVWVKKLNWLFMTPIDTFYDPKCYYRRNYTSRGGADQRYVPVKHFQQKNREITLQSGR
jgi:hypothetical protein